jgi:hypothetical protein
MQMVHLLILLILARYNKPIAAGHLIRGIHTLPLPLRTEFHATGTAKTFYKRIQECETAGWVHGEYPHQVAAAKRLTLTDTGREVLHTIHACFPAGWCYDRE